MTSFITWRASDVEKAIFNLLKQMLPNTKLQDLEKKPNSEIREIKPPRDGIAYVGEYLMEMAMTGIPGMLGSSDKIKIEQYWNKDGNCIGFMFQGKKYMFAKEKLPERGQEISSQGQNNKLNVSLDSDLVRAMTRAIGENNNMEIYGTEILVIEPAIDGVAFVQKARGVAALARKGSTVVEKSVWFDAVRLYDAKGTFLGMQVTDDNLFNEYKVANSGLVKADAKTMEMINNANKKLEAVRDVNGSIVGLDLTALSKKQQFERGQTQITERMTPNIPENSELAKYLEQYPDATVSVEKRPYGNYLTYLPKDKYPNVLPQQRYKSWSWGGKAQTGVVRDFQKEM